MIPVGDATGSGTGDDTSNEWGTGMCVKANKTDRIATLYNNLVGTHKHTKCQHYNQLSPQERSR